MSATFGENIKITLFGQSHGEAVGCVIDGLPSGIKPDMDFIKAQLKRRSPSGNSGNCVTGRAEDDEFRIVSGLVSGVTCGAPVTCIIPNKDADSNEYSEFSYKPRPSHSDYPAFVKFGKFNDFRGGGVFSGRLTAPLLFAGALCQNILSERFGIVINAKAEISLDVEKARASGDSVGGIIKCRGEHIPAGIGDILFGSLESRLSALCFSIPGVKGIEFGKGFEFANMLGSEANDIYNIDSDGKIYTETNNNGGILGGITTGMPVEFSLAVKPTPSISAKQETVNLENGRREKLVINGRHDACIALRAEPLAEAALAIVLADLIGVK